MLTSLVMISFDLVIVSGLFGIACYVIVPRIMTIIEGDPKDRRSLLEAVEATVTLRRVDSLIYLHQLLKLWLAPHVVSASLMLALMCVHIVQVTLFTVR